MEFPCFEHKFEWPEFFQASEIRGLNALIVLLMKEIVPVTQLNILSLMVIMYDYAL